MTHCSLVVRDEIPELALRISRIRDELNGP